MSDGSPWRPVIHIKDVCSAFIAGITAPIELISGQSFNVGINDGKVDPAGRLWFGTMDNFEKKKIRFFILFG